MLKNAIAVIDRKPLSKVFDTAKIMPKVPRSKQQITKKYHKCHTQFKFTKNA